MAEKASRKIDEIITEIGRKYGAFCAYKIQRQIGGTEVFQIAFIFDNECGEEKFHNIFSDLSEKLCTPHIELIILNTAPPTISYIILKDGKEVYCDNKEKLKSFRAKITEQYLDFRNEVRGHTEVSLKKTGNI